jgi:HEAT repeat protein
MWSTDPFPGGPRAFVRRRARDWHGCSLLRPPDPRVAVNPRAVRRQLRFPRFIVAGRSTEVQFGQLQSTKMRASLSNLIDRLTVDEPRVNSADSVSWHAYREAEQLCDLSLISELDAFLNSNPSPRKRSAAYLIVGSIGKNRCEPECARVLIGYARQEKDKYALAKILDCLAEIPKPEPIDLEPLFALLQDKRWLVRQAAIRSLINVSSSAPEERLLEFLGSTTHAMDIVYCHRTLSRIGTSKSLAAIRSSLGSRKRDVKLSAAAAIAAIEARNNA